MATEIERKFLIACEPHQLPEGEDSSIVQAYLNLDPERNVRVRIEDSQATLTIKGKTSGISRPEFEFPIPLAEAEGLLKLAVGSVVGKTRRRVPAGDLTWEIDFFHGANTGLVIAEIELESEMQAFESPSWLGEEVSHDPRYLNSMLAQVPFRDW